jgi:hypothetical protein
LTLQINLKTACGCTQKFVMRMNWIPMFWAVPLYAGGVNGPCQPQFVTPSTRVFRQVSHKYLSKVRMRLFFEEVLE